MATWEAQPHTLAKITILRKYLDAWFAIMGRAAQGHDLFYIDGFAGPGRYDRGEAGSPLVAVESAIGAIDSAASAQSWVARDVNCLFVESDEETVLRLEEELHTRALHARVRKKIYRGEFDRVLDQLSREFPCALGSCPLFVFLDPFGATGLSFQEIASILRSTRSEVFLHFDHDGAARIISSLNKGYNRAAAESLTRVFGDRSWKAIAELQQDCQPSFDVVARKLVSLYVRRIRTIAKFAYPFQMITPKRRAMSEVGYHLVFASNHPRGLEKMKEVMKSVGQDGQYKFSNFRSQQLILFVDSEDASLDSQLLLEEFLGRTGVSWDELQRFTLNETRFTNPRAMLAQLERSGMVVVHSPGNRRRFSYPGRLEQVISFDFPTWRETDG